MAYLSSFHSASRNVQVDIFTDPTAKLQSTLGMLKSLNPRSVGRFMGVKSEPFDGLSAVDVSHLATFEQLQLHADLAFGRFSDIPFHIGAHQPTWRRICL